MNGRQADVRQLDVLAFGLDAGQLSGQIPLSEMSRLCDSLFGTPTQAAMVAWSARGSLQTASVGPPSPWLHLAARVDVTLQCQRCLQPLAQALEVDRHFRFVHDAEEAERQDEVAEEDVLALAPRLDVWELLEDELILALPLVPRHAGRCPVPLPLPSDAAQQPAASPFAALAALRKDGG